MALEQPNVVTTDVMKEVALGRVAGPFLLPYSPTLRYPQWGWFQTNTQTNSGPSSISLSSNSGATSINFSTSYEECGLQYITINNAIQGILSLGQGCYSAKTDIESTFTLFDSALLTMSFSVCTWEGSYYYDQVLPFGLRSAPQHDAVAV